MGHNEKAAYFCCVTLLYALSGKDHDNVNVPPTQGRCDGGGLGWERVTEVTNGSHTKVSPVNVESE